MYCIVSVEFTGKGGLILIEILAFEQENKSKPFIPKGTYPRTAESGSVELVQVNTLSFIFWGLSFRIKYSHELL